jgi:hypothetical protein
MLSQHETCHDNEYLVFSVEPRDQHEMKGMLDAVSEPFLPVLGCYKGVEEISYVVQDTSFTRWLLQPYLQTQESVLHLGTKSRPNNPRRATLIYVDKATGELTDKHEPLGWFWPCTERQALACDAYTKHGEHYFIANYIKPRRKGGLVEAIAKSTPIGSWVNVTV